MKATVEETCTWIGKVVISIVGLSVFTVAVDKATEAARKSVELYKTKKEEKQLKKELES